MCNIAKITWACLILFGLHPVLTASMGLPFLRKEKNPVTTVGIFIMQAEFIKSAVKEMNVTSLKSLEDECVMPDLLEVKISFVATRNSFALLSIGLWNERQNHLNKNILKQN